MASRDRDPRLQTELDVLVDAAVRLRRAVLVGDSVDDDLADLRDALVAVEGFVALVPPLSARDKAELRIEANGGRL